MICHGHYVTDGRARMHIAREHSAVGNNQMYYAAGNVVNVFRIEQFSGVAFCAVPSAPIKIQSIVFRRYFVSIFALIVICDKARSDNRPVSYQGDVFSPFVQVVGHVVRDNPFKRHSGQSGAFFDK
jgi:hypothetical protein